MNRLILSTLDAVASPAVFLSGHVLRLVRRAGVSRLPLAKRALLSAGVFPIRSHYYEPLFDERDLHGDLSTPRTLAGIDWNESGQLRLLQELSPFGSQTPAFEPNGYFGPGDVECWFSVLRHFKPKRVIEVGSGYSTLVCMDAIRRNREETGRDCAITCIEPYEGRSLAQYQGQICLLRKPVEEISPETFAELEAHDILFIDSSHVIRPQGDVVTEILEILPALKPGVIVHFHDIYSPLDYPRRLVVENVCFWNEQYLLEAFLTHNRDWEILAALNFLKHQHHAKLSEVCPRLAAAHEPASFYIRKLH